MSWILGPTFDTIDTTEHVIDTTGMLIASTTTPCEGFSITLSLPSLFQVNAVYGYLSTSVSLGIYYRPQGNTNWWLLQSPYVISGNSSSEVIKYVKSLGLPLDTYEILVYRITPSHEGDANYQDTVRIKEITNVIYSKLRYNNTAILGLKIRATDQLSGQAPTVTSLVAGMRVAIPEIVDDIWTGKMTYEKDSLTQTIKYYSDNPVWCLYDILTNDRYGLADYYRLDENKRGIMLANFYVNAKYCDELISYIDSSGVIQTRKRFTLNIVLDQSKDAIEWISTIAAAMRATVFYTEGLFWLDVDRPKYMSQIFNMSNIKDYAQAGTSYKSIPNTYEVQWINPDLNYEVDTFRVESTEVQLNPRIEERKKALLLLGVTNLEQAKSLAKYAMLAGQHRTKIVTFKTGTDGLRSTIADVIGIQHDIPQWGWGGKVVSYDPGTLTLTLSSSFAPQHYSTDSYGNTVISFYYIQLVTSAGNIEEFAIAEDNWDGSDRNTIILPTAPITEPSIDSTYIIGEQSSGKVAKFKIASIRRDTDELCEITAVTYAEQIYTLSDDTTDMGDWVVTNNSILVNPLQATVSDVQVADRMYIAKDGTIKAGIGVYYTPPTNSSFWKGATIWYGIEGQTLSFNSMPLDSSGSVFITDIIEGQTYAVVVASEYKDGTKQNYLSLLDDPVAHKVVTAYGKILPPADVTGFNPTIKDYSVNLTWDKNVELDIAGYEIWQDEVLIDNLIKATTYSVGTLAAGIHTWDIKAVDTSGNKSINFTSTEINITQAEAPVVSHEFVSENVVLSWNQPFSKFPIVAYRIMYNGITVEVNALTYTLKAAWSGARVFSIVAIDGAGNVGSAGTTSITVEVPSAVINFVPQVIDNNVLFTWVAPEQNTLPIASYEFRKGDTYDGVNTKVIGSVTGTFATFLESQAGTYLYWVTAVDTAGNTGVPVSYSATVTSPPDFVLFTEDTLDWVGTKTNAVISDTGLTLPVNTIETYQGHFDSHGWTSPNAQVVAGYPVYIQPGLSTGSYEEIIDYGVTLSCKISLALDVNSISGGVNLVTTLSTSANGTTWIPYTAGLTEVFASGFRFLKIHIDANTSVGGVTTITNAKVTLDMRLRTAQKEMYCPTTGAIWDITGDFTDIQSVSVTAYKSTVPISTIYDFNDIANPTQVRIYLLNSMTGAPVAGTASVTLRGV